METIRRIDRMEDCLPSLEEIAKTQLNSIIDTLKFLAKKAVNTPDKATAQLAIAGVQKAIKGIPKNDPKKMIDDALYKHEKEMKAYILEGFTDIAKGLTVVDENNKAGFHNYGGGIMHRLEEMKERINGIDSAILPKSLIRQQRLGAGEGFTDGFR